MLKRMDWILNIFIGCCTGAFLGHGLYVFWDYQTHSDLYAAQSAPWYTSILILGAVTVLLLAVAVVLKLILRKKRR